MAALTFLVTVFALITPTSAAVPQLERVPLSATAVVPSAIAPLTIRAAAPAALPQPAAAPTTMPTGGYVISLIHRIFPAKAWNDAVTVAWCESKFRANDIGFDSNGTHDRGLFQLNDGGTQQYLFRMLGLNPNRLELGFDPVLNVRAAALLYARDGWSQWSCASALA